MAYLSGIKHRLLMREEPIWGSAYSVAVPGTAISLTDHAYYSKIDVYTRPGARVSTQSSLLASPGIAGSSAWGRSRTTAGGSFSFYLPRVGAAEQTDFGFLIFFKHLFGEVASGGTVKVIPGQGSSANGAKFNFSPYDNPIELKVAHGATHPNVNAEGMYTDGKSLSFLSYYGPNDVHLYTGVSITSMTINAADANSLVTADVNFIARSSTRCYLDDDKIKVYGANNDVMDQYADDTQTVTGGNAIYNSLGTFLSSSRDVTGNFPAGFSQLELNIDGTAYITGTNPDFQVSGINLNISRPVSFSGMFGNNLANTSLGQRMIADSPPLLTASKTMSGSFSVPQLMGADRENTGTAQNFSEKIRRSALGYDRDANDITLKIRFRAEPDATKNQYEFTMNNIRFGNTEFASNDLSHAMNNINWSLEASRIPSGSDTRLASMLYTYKT